MSILDLRARIRCDRCDAEFSTDIPLDSKHGPEYTVFEIITQNLDFVETKGYRMSFLLEAGYHDGEFYCPKCWESKSEELFVAAVRAGQVLEDQMEDEDTAKYHQYLPRLRLDGLSE